MTYKRTLKAGLVTALKQTFDNDYPDDKLRNLHVSIEFPVKKQEYPSIWVNYEAALLQAAGIDHVEIAESGAQTLRWRFEGHASFTVAALSSLECDRIYDELVRVMAFARQSNIIGSFRQKIENNDLIAMNFDFDRIEDHGDAANPGTPWETDETIYESTIAMQVVGEFSTDVDTGDIVPISRIEVIGRIAPSTEEDPDSPRTVNITTSTPPPVYDPSAWH